MTVAAALSTLIWLYLLCLRGAFWRVRPAAGPVRSPGRAVRVVAVVPARNEHDVIAAAVDSLLAQRFEGSLHVVVVDDASTDDTGAIAREAAARVGATERLTVIRGSGPPSGWSGKVAAMARGVEAAAAFAPDWLLFTDADIHHEPDNLASLLAIAAGAEPQRTGSDPAAGARAAGIPGAGDRTAPGSAAERTGRDLVSFMVRLSTTNAAERALIPAFVFFFFKLYPPRWIARDGMRTAGAAGGCMLVRPQVLARSGGLAAIRGEIIDDCALARSIKRSGGRLWLGLATTARSLRPYVRVAELGRMISRTAFNQLGHSWLLLAGTLVGLALTYLVPPLALFGGIAAAASGGSANAAGPWMGGFHAGAFWAGGIRTAALGAAAWAIMTACYLPMVRWYRLPVWWALTLPAAALFHAGATVHSALQYARGAGGRWKGRVQDAQ